VQSVAEDDLWCVAETTERGARDSGGAYQRESKRLMTRYYTRGNGKLPPRDIDVGACLNVDVDADEDHGCLRFSEG